MLNLPESDSQTFDNTRVAAYKFCPRSFLIGHVLHFKRTGIAAPLVFGSAWHGGMDYVWRASKEGLSVMDHTEFAMDGFKEAWEEEGYEFDLSFDKAAELGARTPGNAKAMFHDYIIHHEVMLREAEVVAIEQPFAVPVPGIENTWYIGKLDKRINWRNNKVVLEHKTTTDYSVDYGFQPRWVEQWFSSPQVKGYEFGGSLYYPGLDGVWVDGALVHKKVRKFKLIPVKHSIPLIIEWMNDTKNWINRIKKDVATFNEAGKLVDGCFPKNEDNCFGKYGTCQYLDICRHCVDPTQLDGPPAGFKEEKWEPFSVLGLDKLVQGVDK